MKFALVEPNIGGRGALAISALKFLHLRTKLPHNVSTNSLNTALTYAGVGYS